MSDISVSEIKKLLRSLLISAEHGVALKDLTKDFYDTVGYALPYRRLGYNTLEDMLSDIPDTVRVSRDCTGQIRLFGVANQDTEHIADMVKKQKKGSFNPYKPPPKAQGVQQAQRGKRPPRASFNSRYASSSFSAPPRYTNRYQRSQPLPQTNHFDYDSIYQRAPPGFRPNTNYPPSHSQCNSTYGYNAPPQPFPNAQSYNYQSKPAPKYTPIGGNIPPSELLSPNKNSHKLNDTKGAIYDLLFQRSEGVLGAHLEEEYFRVYRDKLPYHKLGYDNSKQFIESIPDVVRIDRVDGREMCYLARRPEKSSPVRNDKSNEWPETTQITIESFFPPKETEHPKSPDRKSADEIETIDLTQVTIDLTQVAIEPDSDKNNEIVLTEDEKKRHMNDLKSKVYIFLLGKGSLVPIDEFEYQYRVINREDPEIAYRLLGFSHLEEFLHSILDVVVLVRDGKDGNLSIGVRIRNTSPPLIPPPRIIPHQGISRMPPPQNMMRPCPPPLHPIMRGPIPNSGFVPPGAPMHHMRPHRFPPPPNQNIRFPHHPPGPPLLPFMPPMPPLLPEPPRPPNSHEPPGFDPSLPNSDLFSPNQTLASEFSSLFMSNPPAQPFGITTTKINSLSMDFSKAQKEFVETQIMSIVSGRGEVNPRLASEPVLRYLEGTNVVLLAGEDFGKCACLAVALTHGLNILSDSNQSLVICNDMIGMQKMFECLETVAFNTGLKVASYESVDKLVALKQNSHIVVIVYTMVEQYISKCDISQLTRIGIYNLTTDPNSYNEFIFNLKRSRCGKLEEIKFFFATNPHNEAGSYILKLVNTVMTSKCSFSYYGKDQANHLTLIPHDTESSQIHTESQMQLRPRLFASITSNRLDIPNHFDKFLLPLKASCNNFTILSNHMEEALLQQSLALVALMKVEPTSHLTQVVILVPNEQQAKDFQELCGAMGKLEKIITSLVNTKTTKEDIRYSHICIGWPKEIAHTSKNQTSFSKITLIIIFRIDLEQKNEYLFELFQSCQTPQVIVVGSNYTRQILNFEAKFMSEPKHITFLARETY